MAMNVINVATTAQASLNALGRWPELQTELSAFVGAAEAFRITKQDSALGYMSLTSQQLTGMKNIINGGNDTLIAAAIVNAIIAKNKAQDDYASSDLAKFRDSVHVILKASVEGHTELGKMVYAGERKDYASDLMTSAELSMTDSIKDKLPPQPGNTPEQNDLFNTNRASQIIEANKTRNISYLAELLDSAIAIKYPFKTVAAANGVTEIIELKQKVGDIGPGKKTFFWMEDLIANSTYGWQIDGKDVTGPEFGNIHDAWVAAAAATDTGLEAGGQGLTNAGDDIVEGAGAVVDAAAGAAAAAAAAMNPMNGLMDMVTGLVGMAVAVGVLAVIAIGIGVLAYFLYKRFTKEHPKMLAEAQAQLGGIKTRLMDASGYATDYYVVQNAIMKDAIVKNPDAIAIALQAEGVPMAASKMAIAQVEHLPPALTTPRTEEGKKTVEMAQQAMPNTDQIAKQMLGSGMVPGMGGGMPGMGAPPAAPPAAPVAGAPPAQAQGQQISPQQAMQMAQLAQNFA